MSLFQYITSQNFSEIVHSHNFTGNTLSNILISKTNLMGSRLTNEYGEEVNLYEWSFGNFGNSVKLGAILGVFSGAFVTIAYTLTFFANGIADLLGSGAFFIISSTLFGGVLGAFIYLNFQVLGFALKAFSSISSIFISVLLLFANSIYAWTILIVIPILTVSHKYLSAKLPEWINIALDNFMANLIKNLFLIGSIWLIARMTGNSLSHWIMANVETKAFVDRLYTVHGNILYLVK